MAPSPSGVSHYLAEWYRDDLSQNAMDQSFAMLRKGARLTAADGVSATVVLTVCVPTDDVIFCIFRATAPEEVAAVCNRAGIPAARVSAATVAA